MIRSRPWIALLAILLVSFTVATAFAQGSDRNSWQQPEAIMDSLGIGPGMIVGEAGAGDGYFTFHLAKRVGTMGTIYANDIDRRALKRLEDKCGRGDVRNIITITGKIDDPLFPKRKLDCVVMMMAFHDFEKPVEWMKNVVPSLKPGAFLAIIDQDPDKTNRDRGHFWTKERVLSTMEETEFVLIRLYTFLERDNIYVYKVQ
jgi:ubiquinone/menaquinone biosynthesis C-methylase UbiE